MIVYKAGKITGFATSWGARDEKWPAWHVRVSLRVLEECRISWFLFSGAASEQLVWAGHVVKVITISNYNKHQ